MVHREQLSARNSELNSLRHFASSFLGLSISTIASLSATRPSTSLLPPIAFFIDLELERAATCGIPTRMSFHGMLGWKMNVDNIFVANTQSAVNSVKTDTGSICHAQPA